MQDNPLRLLAYISDYTGPGKDLLKDVETIVASSKRNNPALGITGVLFHHAGRFIQVIEGEAKALATLRRTLEQDPRHTHIHYLIDEAVKERGFADWNMDYFDLDRGQALDPAEMRRITAAYRINLVPRSDTLVQIYKAMLANGTFRE